MMVSAPIKILKNHIYCSSYCYLLLKIQLIRKKKIKITSNPTIQKKMVYYPF